MPPEENDIRSELEAQFEAAETGTPAPPASAPSAAPASSAPAPSEGAAPTAPAPAPTGQKPGDNPAQDAKDANTVAKAVAEGRPIPERLKAKWAGEWDKLPQPVREQFHEYESHIGSLASKYGKGNQAWEKAQQLFAPYEAMVKGEGGDFYGAVSNLLETARILRQGSPEQKASLIRATMQQFGINPSQLGFASSAPAPGADPNAAAPASAPSVSDELIQRINSMERTLLTREGEAVHTMRQNVLSEVQSFVEDPANIYLQQPGFLDTMVQLINSGAASDLKTAYEKAAWLVPEVRELKIATASQQQASQAAQAAAAARASAVSPPGQNPGPVKRDLSQLSLAETLELAWNGELN